MAFLLRTRRLDINRMDLKPQENLEVIHAILTATINTTLDKLKQLQIRYYGKGVTPEQEAKKWATSVTNMMRSVRLSNLTTEWQVDDVIRRASDPKMKFTLDIYELNKLKECRRKIVETVPERFKEIIVELKKVLKYLELYCLSFYDHDNDAKLETASQYEIQIQHYKNEILTYLDTLQTMGNKFRNTGFYYSDLSSLGRELCRKADCQNAPFLMIFPEACECVRETCWNMTSWIRHDVNYAAYLAHDISDLEKTKLEIAKMLRNNKHKFHKVNFRLKHIKMEIENYNEEYAKLTEKENTLLVEEEFLLSETNEMGLEIEMKDYRRDEVIKNAANTPPEILYEKYSELSEELRTLRMTWPGMKRQLANVRTKLSRVVQRKKALETSKSEMTELEEEIAQIEGLKIEKDIEMVAIEKELDLARKIHLYKSTSDSIAKIFHNMPVETNNTRLPDRRGTCDPFERACHVVSQHIDEDWAQLYRNLPFVPPRGLKTIDNDISRFSMEEARVGTEETAERCLDRWRRFHTRAKLDDLKDTLAVIKKSEILQEIELELNPPVPVEPEDDEVVYSYVEAYLIPFLKEVERFDELRAMGRISYET